MADKRWSATLTRAEFACRCGCGRADMDAVFMRRLQRLRDSVGEPFKITSGFRCPGHNCTVSRTGRTGPHTTGRAVDIACSHALFWEMRAEAPELGFTGIGEKQHGPAARRYIHLDDLPNAPGQPRPHGWTYP